MEPTSVRTISWLRASPVRMVFNGRSARLMRSRIGSATPA
jgi:hypothetical protein